MPMTESLPQSKQHCSNCNSTFMEKQPTGYCQFCATNGMEGKLIDDLNGEDVLAAVTDILHENYLAKTHWDECKCGHNVRRHHLKGGDTKAGCSECPNCFAYDPKYI